MQIQTLDKGGDGLKATAPEVHSLTLGGQIAVTPALHGTLEGITTLGVWKNNLDGRQKQNTIMIPVLSFISPYRKL